MYVPINVAGGVYQHKSRPLSSQVTRNFWPQQQSGAGTSEYILETFPGLKAFATGSGADRGMFVHRGVLYKVTGTTLYSVNSAGASTTLGTIAGLSRCIFDGLATSVIITTGGSVYEWDGSTMTLGTDVDFETPNAVTVLNNQALYDGDDGRFCSSDVGDALAINSLNYASAESNSDILLRPYAFQQIVYMMGANTIEPWWNSGSGNPPFDRTEGGMIQVGLGALYSVDKTDKVIYFLGDDLDIYRMSANGIENGFTPQPLLREITKFTTTDDAIGWCMNYQGQNFYVLKFPTENRTFCYPEGGQWFELSSSAYDAGAVAGRYRGNSYAFAYGKHLIADEDGNILELDDETYTDSGDTIKRVRDLSPIHGGLVQQPGKGIELSSFRLIMETGIGVVSGQGADPKIMLSFSTDGGRTYSTEQWGDVGSLGDYLTEVVWDGINAAGKSIDIRLSTSDPVYFSVHSAGAEIEVGI